MQVLMKKGVSASKTSREKQTVFTPAVQQARSDLDRSTARNNCREEKVACHLVKSKLHHGGETKNPALHQGQR